MSEREQLVALARIHQLLGEQRIEYWLFGGWAVDFHAGAVTRPHDDLDLGVWLEDYDGVAALLTADGWTHAPDEGEDGYTGYERGGVRLELAFLSRDEEGKMYTPLRTTVVGHGRRRRSRTTSGRSAAYAPGSSACGH